MKSAEKAKGVTLDPIIDKAEDSYREPFTFNAVKFLKMTDDLNLGTIFDVRKCSLYLRFIKDNSSGSESQRD
jgi:hypothetical protein